ncbi:MAG: hypothetical protein GVY17_03080 [Cyanobacteria bacterium]|jgi:hypothetical protein|nr:hypothetical protein [Cyanobacteria bacterium GSL.Bin21]
MYIDDEVGYIGMNFFLDNALEQSLPEILDSLTHIGATSIPILRADAREQLVHTAQNLSYQQEVEGDRFAISNKYKSFLVILLALGCLCD